MLENISGQATTTPDAIEIKTPIARLENIISEARSSEKEIKSFLAGKLYQQEITTQELIDALLYSSLPVTRQSTPADVSS